ncbi:7532_t:CDS:2 [Funneliformis geosporum]|uniref:7532_t:CDS:1 n=1 Tax=Funneliformis geosporum TaxID=1117311 RepID=A0A9W4WH40_9GLOM|nr:7532_t:CDS:2 [Funneliformis geosporum]
MVAQIDPSTDPTNDTLITNVEKMREENDDDQDNVHFADDNKTYIFNKDENLQGMELSPEVSPINDENNHNDEILFLKLLPEKFTKRTEVKLPYLIELHNIIHEIKERTKRYGGGVDNEEIDGMKLSLKFCEDFIKLRSLSRKKRSEMEERINKKQSSIRQIESMISKYVKDIEVLQER